MTDISAAIRLRGLVSKLAKTQAECNALLALLNQRGAVTEEQWSKAVSRETALLVGKSFDEILAGIVDGEPKRGARGSSLGPGEKSE